MNRLLPTAASIAAMAALAVAQPVGYDFNDDGSSDYPVSVISYDQANPDVGAARIWSGASKTIIHTIVGTETNTLFGWSTGSAGDLDGDGKADLIVGEPFWSAASNYEGRIQVFSGDDASVLLTISGPYVDTGLGRYVTGIGDWNGDGTPDIVSSGWDIADTDGDGIGDDPIGMVFVFSGIDGSILAEITDPTATASFGYSVFGLGDINGDSKADIAIVDRDAEFIPGSGIKGQVSIFVGNATPGLYDITNAHEIIDNLDPDIRGFGSQIDVMHPDLWLDKATIQVMSLLHPYTGGVNQAEVKIDILKIDGAQTGGKGLRPSLKLAGDVNVDGKVNALDIQDSISQLGIDPQALGVMPIVDSNKDNIIDATDIQVVLDGYGTATDVYEGLWDGTRLLSVAGGGAGFGNTSGISIRPVGPPLNLPATKLEPAIRPIDDCPLALTTPPTGGSLLFSLLRGEEGANCNDCPSYENEPDCYECESDKGISGGSVSVDKEQPLTTETVTFKAEGVTETPGQLKCKETCGEDGVTLPTPLGTPSYVWKVYTKGINGWPAEFDPNDGHLGWPTGDTISGIGGSACEEKKAVCWAAPSSPCVPDPRWTRVGEKEVKFADFRLDSTCVADIPSDKKRVKVGIGEEIEIEVINGGAALISWTVNGADKGEHPSPYTVEAQASKGTLEVIAEINGCQRSVNFEVIEPTNVNYTPCTLAVHHDFGQKDIGFYLKMDLDPDNVSFYNVAFREGYAEATSMNGYYLSNAAPPHLLGPWRGVREDNTVIARDHSSATRPSDDFNVGGFTWKIPFIYGVTGSGTTHEPDDKFETSVVVMQADCVKKSKGGFTTPFGCRTSGTLTPNFTGCGINGQ